MRGGAFDEKGNHDAWSILDIWTKSWSQENWNAPFARWKFARTYSAKVSRDGGSRIGSRLSMNSAMALCCEARGLHLGRHDLDPHVR